MATCRDTIRSAYRRSGIIGLGVSISSAQADVGLELLREMFNGMLGNGLFGALDGHYLDTADAYTAKEGQLIYNSMAATITFPATIVDEDDGKTRQPRDGAIIAVVNPTTGVPAIRLYDSLIGQWQDINALTLEAVCPMTGRYEGHIKNLLAVHLADDAGMQISRLLARNASLAKLAIGSRYDGKRKPGVVEYF